MEGLTAKVSREVSPLPDPRTTINNIIDLRAAAAKLALRRSSGVCVMLRLAATVLLLCATPVRAAGDDALWNAMKAGFDSLPAFAWDGGSAKQFKVRLSRTSTCEVYRETYIADPAAKGHVMARNRLPVTARDYATVSGSAMKLQSGYTMLTFDAGSPVAADRLARLYDAYKAQCR